MVDGNNEEKKNERGMSLGLPEDEEFDIITGEAECPYFDFISITDRWLPTSESLQKALEGKFEACYVLFANSGGFVVPWTKSKFKKEFKKFSDKRNQDEDSPTVKRITLSKEEALKLIKGNE